MIPVDVFVSLSAVLALAGLLLAVARWVGLGRCRDCWRPCVPWDAYCGEHRP